MSKHHQPREEWEQELRDVQRNVLPQERLRGTSILFRRVTEEGEAPIRGPRELVLVLLALLFFGVAIILGSLTFSTREWLLAVPMALALVAAGVLMLLAFGDRRPGSALGQSKD